MSSPKKPLKPSTTANEARRTNVLLEALSAEFRTFGEDLSSVRRELGSVKAAVTELGEDMKILKPAVQKNTRDIEDIKASITRIEKRLEAAEARFPA